MRPSQSSLPVVCRRLSRWGVLLGVGCARFGYELADGAALGAGGSSATALPAGASGSGGSSSLDGTGGTLPGSGGGRGPGEMPEDVDPPGATADSGPRRCLGSGAFGDVVALDGLPPPPLFGPALSADGLTLYFAANGDLFSAGRARREDTTFTEVDPVVGVNSGQPELTPYLSRDGRALYFARDLDGSGLLRDLMQSERASTNDPFGSPTALTTLNDPFGSELSPHLRADGLELFFSSSRFGGPGLFDLWRSIRPAAEAAFANPEPVPGLNSSLDDSGITLGADGLSAVVSSARDGSLGSRDLWIATRPSLGGDFGINANLEDVNSAQNDTDPALGPNDAELVFASDRSGESLLYSAARLCGP